MVGQAGRSTAVLALTLALSGGGPAGLAAAIMLARRGWRGIEVWERLSAPPASDATEWGDASRSYNLGVTTRGQMVLERLHVLDRVVEHSAHLDGAMSWTPEKPEPQISARLNTQDPYLTQVRLAACCEGVKRCLILPTSPTYLSAVGHSAGSAGIVPGRGHPPTARGRSHAAL